MSRRGWNVVLAALCAAVLVAFLVLTSYAVARVAVAMIGSVAAGQD